MTTPLLELCAVEKAFAERGGVLRRERHRIQVLDGVDLAIEDGEVFGLAGESGCGKTTLARLVMRLLEPSGGKLHLAGSSYRAWTRRPRRDFYRQVQMVFQDPYASLNPRLRVHRILGEMLAIHGLAAGDRRAASVEMLEQVGLTAADLDKFPHEFSGGQRQRIAIARALALRPDLLILDEPTSSLDRSVQFQVLTLLKDIQTRFGLTYLFISHDLKVVKSLCHDIIVMRRGRVVEAGNAATVFSSPEHPYTQELLSAAMR